MKKTREHRRLYRHVGPGILERLSAGPHTPDELARALYGSSDPKALNALYVAIHRLRAGGAAIAFDEESGRYALAEVTA